jgi:hypothetical protein
VARAAAERRGALGEGQQEGVEAVASSGATRGGQERQGGLGQRGTVASGGAAARQRGSRGRRWGRGRQGLRCKLQKLKGPHCNTKFPTILKLK